MAGNRGRSRCADQTVGDESAQLTAQSQSQGDARRITPLCRAGFIAPGQQRTSLIDTVKNRKGKTSHKKAQESQAYFLRLLCVFVAALASAVSGHAQDAAARIKASEYALGMIRGPQRIDAINTIEYWGTGSMGQPPANITYHVSLSYLTPAIRVDIT